MQTPPQSGPTLHTWKEIASYLGVSVRAAQMWEREAGLPVRRPPGEHGHVAADPEQIRDWAAHREKPASWWRGHSARTLAVWLLPLILLVLLAHDLIEHHGLFLSAQPATILVNGTVASALDDQRHEIWRVEFDDPLDARAYSGSALGISPRWIIEDLDGDGRREAVLVEVPLASGAPHRLHVVDDQGRIRWSYPPRVHDHPELVTVLRTLSAGAGRRAILIHFCGLPRHEGTFLMFSADGRMLSHFQHGGHLDQIAVSGDTVLLGGECMRTHAAEVHRFRIVQADGSFALRADAEIQFARSCVNRLLSRANRVSGLAILADGNLVTISELIDEVQYDVYHEMSRDLTPRRCWASDAFLRLHRRLELEGRLNHSFTEAEEAALCLTSSHSQ